MLLNIVLFCLIGIPAVAAEISSVCGEIRMSSNDTKAFFLEGVNCEVAGEDVYLTTINLDFCIGMNKDTHKMEWKRFGAAGDYCIDCVANKVRGGTRSLLACRCGDDPHSSRAITSTLDLDAGLGYSNHMFWCIAPTRRSISQPPKAEIDATLSANCGDIRMSQDLAANFTLQANCHNPGDTVMFPASLDLNACIAIDKDSKLTWGSGHAGDLCTGCTAGKTDINKSYLTCTCAANGVTGHGSMVTSTLELDAGIKVDDEHLWCDPVLRRDSIPSQPPVVSKRDDGYFTDRCSDITLLDGEKLKANCGATSIKGIHIASVLDLNKCIGYNTSSKTLEWSPNGEIDTWCSGCGLTLGGMVFGCECGGIGPDHIAFASLNEGIHYKDGVLYCDRIVE